MGTVAEVLDPAGFQPGLRFGPFKLLKLLGQGGCAQVWLALDEGPQGFRKRVALKVVHGQGQEAKTVFQTLVNEARVGGHLKHPNVVDLYRIGEVRGSWYIAMEYIEGYDLSVLLGRVRTLGLSLPTSIIAEIGLRIAQALDYAHNASDDEGNPLRLVHRDLKPANVLVSTSGRVKVADFGIAKATTNVKSTTVGHLKGTPCYMAPEVWRGSREFKARMDLFSLGSMLWEMCTGARLAQGTNLAAVAGRLMFGDAGEEAALVRDSHPELVELLHGLLERKPKRRTQTAAEVVTQLREILRLVPRPGELDLFLSLVNRGALPEPERRETAHTLITPMDLDASWSAAFSLARGEAFAAPGTLQFRPPELDFDDSLDSADSGAIAAVSSPALGSTEDLFGDDLPPIVARASSASDDPAPDTFLDPFERLARAETPAPGVPPVEDPDVTADTAVHLNARPATTPEVRDDEPGDAQEVTATRVLPVQAPRSRGWLGLAAVAALALGAWMLRPASEPPAPEEAPGQSSVPWNEAEPPAVDLPELAAAEALDSAPPTASKEPIAKPAPQPAEPSPRAEPAREEVAAPVREEPAGKPIARPEPTPAPRAAPPAATETPQSAPSGQGCVVFQSTPPGAVVSIDGARTDLVARTGSHSRRGFDEGTLRVTMGEGSRTVSKAVTVRAGRTVAVNCSLADPMTCRVGRSRASCD